MLKNKITAALLGLALCLPVVLAPVPTAQAQDIRIYTHAPEPVDSTDPSKAPFVVIALDLSILGLVSSGDGPLDIFFSALGLGTILDLDTLLDNVDSLLDHTGLTNDAGLGALDIVAQLLYPLLHQLVGLRLAIVVSYTHEYCDTHVILLGCIHHSTENGAAILFTTGTDKVLGPDLPGTLNTGVDLGDALDTVVASLGNPPSGYTLGAPFQGKKIYDELVAYLRGQGTPSAPDLTSSRAVNGSGNYISPLTAICSGTDIQVINLLLSNAAKPKDFASAVNDLNKKDEPGNNPGHETDGFVHNGGQYYVTSSFLLGGPNASGLLGLVHNALGTTNMLLGLTGLGPLLGNQIKPAVYGAANPATVSNRSLLAPQVVQNRLGGAGPLYVGRFTYAPAGNDRAWTGELAKLSLEVGNLANATVQPLTWPGTVAKTNAACSGPNCADVYYQTASNTVAALDLNAGTIQSICGNGSGAGCNNTYLTADDKLVAAKQIAWARGYQVRRAALSQAEYKGLLGFLNGVLGVVEDLLKAITGLLFGYDPSSGCGTKDCGFLGLGCLLGGILGGLEDLLSTILGGVLGLDFSKCDVPSSDAPPARDYMGDILHSQPLAIDYGGSNGVRIFFGTNTGFLHQFSKNSGGEVWRFAPSATMKYFAVWSAGEFEKSHGPYGVDGAPIAYINDANKDGKITDPDNNSKTGDSVYLYFGLRRGGKSYYALDVTNPDQKPELLWTINSKDVSGNKFSELGWTFSMPAIGKAYGNDRKKHVVLIFGGGYDKENDPPAAVGNYKVGTNDDEGTALYVVNALTGKLIEKLNHTDLADSIPSAPTAVDTNGDGFLDYVYVGDTGGRVWRADISDESPVNWSMKLIANLGRHAYTDSDTSHDRRFFHPPDVVRIKVDKQDINRSESGKQPGSKTVRAVIIASGNRAAPLKTATTNYLYVIKDPNEINGPVTPDQLCGTQNNDCDLDSNTTAGWKLKLQESGEKALSSPITLNGTIVFTTYVPYSDSDSDSESDDEDDEDKPSASCTPHEGDGRLYAVDLATGTAADGSNDPSSPINPRGIPGTLQYVGAGRFLARDNTGSSNYTVLSVESPRIWRTYWSARKSAHW